MDESHEFEKTAVVARLGTLAELGLGNPDGIKGFLQDQTEAEQLEYGEGLKSALAPITDPHHYGCIDGRNCKCNADDSPAEVRPRQASGTGMETTVAMNAGSSLVDEVLEALGPEAGIEEVMDGLEDKFVALTGVRHSAHTGGCGKIKETIADQRAIAENPAVTGVAKALMDHPAILEYSGLTFTDEDAAVVRENARTTADKLERGHFDGQRYVDHAVELEPAGVEVLETDETRFHGHAENALVFILARGKGISLSKDKMLKLGLGQAFVVTLDDSVNMATAAGAGDHTVAQRALIANLAEHAAVGDRLPHEQTPVYLITL